MADDNITHRKIPVLSTSFSETSIFDATVMSMPDTSLQDNESINKLQEEINGLKAELQSANREIDNLLTENEKLKSDLEKSNRVIELYKKVGTGEAKCSTPCSKRKVSKTNTQVRRLTSTPIKNNLVDKSSQTVTQTKSPKKTRKSQVYSKKTRNNQHFNGRTK